MSELGTWLIRAREARGLTIEDAERDTRISRRYLQALESEQFDVIPAPVYARGFLRSYSQYLGLDPAEMLALFPRDDQASGGQTVIGANRQGSPPVQQRPVPPSRQQPPSAVGPARPTWRRPDVIDEPPVSARQRQSSPQREEPPARERPARERPARERPLEPMIGVDIGVPAPARRIKTDPAAQQRSMLIGAVAVGVVLVVIVFAYLLSSLGGGSNSPASPTVSTGQNPAA
ncbi:MAG: helix-turn-helix domain-containing protein, partial [Tepidiformaceae bacterium]